MSSVSESKSGTASKADPIPAPTQVKDLSLLSKAHKNYKKSFSLKKSAGKTPRYLVECTSDSGIVVSISKIFKSVFQYPALLVSKVPFENIVKHSSGIADTFKTFNFFKGIKNIYDNSSDKDSKGKKLQGLKLHARNLGIANGVFQTVIGAATFTKLLDNFGAIKIAEITAAMGRSSVAGQTLAAIAPFSVVTNFLEIGNNIVSIARASLRIHENRKNKIEIRHKIRAFNKKNPEIGKFFTSHIDTIKLKQASAVTKLDLLEKDGIITADKIASKEDKFQVKKDAFDDKQKALRNSVAVVRFFKTLEPRYEVRKAKLKVFKAKDQHDAICETRNRILAQWEKRDKKLVAWTAIKSDFDENGLSNDATNPLNRLIAAKQYKWRLQSSGINLKNFQEGVGIVVNTLAIITLLASTILFFSGVATLPATLGITSMFLIISLLGAGNEIYKKYKKPKTAIVKVYKPIYAPAA